MVAELRGSVRRPWRSRVEQALQQDPARAADHAIHDVAVPDQENCRRRPDVVPGGGASSTAQVVGVTATPLRRARGESMLSPATGGGCRASRATERPELRLDRG